MQTAMNQGWVIHPAKNGLNGTFRAPGDQTVGQWALLCGLLAVGESHISGMLETADFSHLVTAIRALGGQATRLAPGHWRIAGRGLGGLAEPSRALQIGRSAGLAHQLAGLLASHPIFAVLDGEARLGKTGTHRLLSALRATGARLRARDRGLPLAIIGAADTLPLDVHLPVPSANIKAALLLAGLNASGLSRIVEPEATPDHGEIMLRRFGAHVAVQTEGRGRVVSLLGQPELHAAEVTIPGDPDLAALPVLAALLVPGSHVTAHGVGLNPLRGALFDVLRQMGAALVTTHTHGGEEPIGDLVAVHSPLHAVETAWETAPALVRSYPLLAVAAATATGSTVLRGLGAVRPGERARMARVAASLRQCGLQADVDDDDLVVHGQSIPPHGGTHIDAPGDAFLAMAGLLTGLLASAPVRVDQADALNRVFPEFTCTLNTLLPSPVLEPA